MLIRLDRALVFPSVSFVRNVINKAGLREAEARIPVVIDCMHVFSADFTAAKGFKAMADDFGERGQRIVFFNLKRSVEPVFTGAGDHDMVIVHSASELEAVLQGEGKDAFYHH